MDAGAAMCTPGITILPASGGNDGCGYPTSDFNESTTLCGINAVGGGAQPAVIQVFYSDEHALTLGCDTPSAPVTPLPGNPGEAKYPLTGDPACVDSMGRPLRPVLFVTDLTGDPGCTAGDLQHGGHPYDPIAVFGTWKTATEGAGNMGTRSAPIRCPRTGGTWAPRPTPSPRPPWPARGRPSAGDPSGAAGAGDSERSCASRSASSPGTPTAFR
jgi:hypothetical protein